MRKTLPYFLLTLLAVLLSASAQAEFYTIERNKSPHQIKAQFLAAEDLVHGIQLSSELDLSGAESLLVPLPNGEVWTAVKKDSYPTENGRAWFGELTAFAGGPQGRFMLIALTNGTYLGEFTLGDAHFLIWPDAESGEHELIRKSSSKIASCATKSRSHLETTEPANPLGSSASGLTHGFEDAIEGNNSKTSGKFAGIVTLDILPLYHSSLNRNDVVNQYTAWVTQANQVFNVSNIAARYSLAAAPISIGAASLPATECFPGLVSSLVWIEDLPDVMQSLRNQYGGDFVALTIPPSVGSCPAAIGDFPNDACGVASAPIRDGFGRKVTFGGQHFWTQRAFTAIRLGCGMSDLTFAHELGHTFGALHESDDDDVPTAPYSPLRSSVFGVEFMYQGDTHATVMACAHTGDTNIYTGDICNRMQQFSSATQTGPGGVAIGDGDHDNRQLIADKVASYSAFRGRSGPTLSILSPSRDGIVDGFSNFFEVSAREVVQGGKEPAIIDLSDQVIWRVRTLEPVTGRDHIILGMGQGRNIVDFDFSSLIGQVGAGTAFELIATVTGSQGDRAQWRMPIQIDLRPPVAQFSQTCSNLECAFDASASTALGGVVDYHWNFKDVSCFPFGGLVCSEVASQGAPTLNHFFPGYQAYDVTLVVSDSLGRLSPGLTRRINLTAPAGNFAQSGSWYNSQRSGHGIDLYRNHQNQYVVFWYTYEEFTGKPTWYISGTGSIINSQWNAPLYKATRAANGSITTQQIGQVGLDFSDPNTAAFTWSFSLAGRTARGWERFERLFGYSGHRTGAWYDPAESGWGLQVNESSNPSHAGHLLALAFYDATGQARWVSGFKSQYPLQQNVTVPVSYHVGQNLCPFPTCFGGAPSLTSTPAGTVTIGMPFTGAPGAASTAVTIPDGSTWFRNTTIHRLAG